MLGSAYRANFLGKGRRRAPGGANSAAATEGNRTSRTDSPPDTEPRAHSIARLPWLGDIVRLSAPDAAGTRVIDGWVVGPGQPPSVTLSVGERRLDVHLTAAVVRPIGLPDIWPVWEWRAVIGAESDGELSLRSSNGRVLARRPPAGRTHKPAELGAIDCPMPGQVVHGDVIEVRGWLLLNGRAASRVEVEVDGSPPVKARLALPRPEIADALPHLADALFCGYQARVMVPQAESGRDLRIRVIGFDEYGPAWLAPPLMCRMEPASDDPADHLVIERGAHLTAELLNRIPTTTEGRHVLVIAHSLRVGGSELWLLELIRRLVGVHHYRVTLISMADGELRSDFELLGINIWITGPRQLTTAIGYQSFVSELALVARASGVDCALLNTLDVFPAADAMRSSGIPTAWVVHESFAVADHAFLNFGPGLVAPVVRAAWEESLASVDELVFVADSTRELFDTYRPRGSRTIPYGIDLSAVNTRTGADFASARDHLGVSRHSLVLLAVGISTPRKGHALLVQAFARVARLFPEAHLVIVGVSDNDYSTHLRARVRCADLASRVTLVPVTRDVTRYFAAADVFVNSSDVESLPRTILEAIAVGVPVLAADVFGARDLIVDTESGWLFRASDSQALTAGLARALASPPAHRATLTAAARCRIEPFLDAAVYAADFARLLTEITSGPRETSSGQT